MTEAVVQCVGRDHSAQNTGEASRSQAHSRLGSQRSSNSAKRIYLGRQEKDRTLLGSAVNSGQTLAIGKSSSCWLIDSGVAHLLIMSQKTFNCCIKFMKSMSVLFNFLTSNKLYKSRCLSELRYCLL